MNSPDLGCNRGIPWDNRLQVPEDNLEDLGFLIHEGESDSWGGGWIRGLDVCCSPCMPTLVEDRAGIKSMVYPKGQHGECSAGGEATPAVDATLASKSLAELGEVLFQKI